MEWSTNTNEWLSKDTWLALNQFPKHWKPFLLFITFGVYIYCDSVPLTINSHVDQHPIKIVYIYK